MRERKLAKDELKKVKTENVLRILIMTKKFRTQQNIKETNAKIEKQARQQLDNNQNDDKVIDYETSEKKR